MTILASGEVYDTPAFSERYLSLISTVLASMKGTRKKYDAKFNAKVAMETIKERKTLNELAAKYEVSPVMISLWKKEFIENQATAFEVPKVGETEIEKEPDRYLRVIDDLQMHVDLPSV